MRAKAKLNLSKFLIYVSIFIFISIFTNLILSVNIYKNEMLKKNMSYADNVLYNHIALIDSSIHLSEGYFDYIYNEFASSGSFSVMRTDLPQIIRMNLRNDGIYRYDTNDIDRLEYKEIHEIIEQNKAYNINNNNTDDTAIFFYEDPEYEFPLIVMYQDFENTSKRLVVLFQMPYHTKYFNKLNQSIDEHDSYSFFLEQGDNLIPFKQNANNQTSNIEKSLKNLYLIKSNYYNYQCAYFIDDSKSNNSFFVLMTLFAVLNISFFIIFITIYNHYKTTKIESATDILTGLYNRRYLFSKVRGYIRKKQYPIGFIVVDVDYLKFINDTYGHLKGDEAINKIAAVLKNVFRENDVVARIGGDEFAILLSDARKEIVAMLIERIKQCIKDENDKKPEELPLSVSMGFYVAESDEEITDTEALFKKADDEMYNSKEISHKEYEKTLIKWCKKYNVAPPKPRK